jgi:hypothetical protein
MQEEQEKLEWWSMFMNMLVELSRSTSGRTIATACIIFVICALILFILITKDVRENRMRRNSMTPEERGYDDYDDYFTRRFKGNEEKELRKMAERVERGRAAIDFLLDHWRSPEERSEFTSDERCFWLKSILCIILGLGQNANDLLIAWAYSDAIFFVVHHPAEDVQTQKAFDTMREMGEALGWSYDKLQKWLGPDGLGLVSISWSREDLPNRDSLIVVYE